MSEESNEALDKFTFSEKISRARCPLVSIVAATNIAFETLEG